MNPSLESLIMEVKKCEGLWNDKRLLAHGLKWRAWAKIGKKFNEPTWDTLPPQEQDVIVDTMRMKWRTLKSGYEEYKRMINANESPKRRKPNFYHMLSFLDANLEKDCGKTFDSKADVKSTTPNNMNDNYPNDHAKPTQNNQLNANEHFLLSLLPDLDKMDRDQIRDFKIYTMTWIRDKFSENPQANSTQGISKECNITSQGVDTTNKESDNISVIAAETSQTRSSTMNRSNPAPTMTTDSLPPITDTPDLTPSHYSTPVADYLRQTISSRLIRALDDAGVEDNKENIMGQPCGGEKNCEIVAFIDLD